MDRYRAVASMNERPRVEGDVGRGLVNGLLIEAAAAVLIVLAIALAVHR